MSNFERTQNDPFDPAANAAAGAVANLAMRTICDAIAVSGLVEDMPAGLGISLGGGYKCLQNNEVMPSVALSSSVQVPDCQTLESYVQVDAARFPKAPRWCEAAGMLACAKLDPGSFPLLRTGFVYVGLDVPHPQFNTGVAYSPGCDEQGRELEPLLVLDTIVPTEEGLGITNFEVADWTVRLHAYRRQHGFSEL